MFWVFLTKRQEKIYNKIGRSLANLQIIYDVMYNNILKSINTTVYSYTFSLKFQIRDTQSYHKDLYIHR